MKTRTRNITINEHDLFSYDISAAFRERCGFKKWDIIKMSVRVPKNFAGDEIHIDETTPLTIQVESESKPEIISSHLHFYDS